MRVFAFLLALAPVVVSSPAHADPVSQDTPAPTSERTPAPAADSSLDRARPAPAEALPEKKQAPGPDVMRPLPAQPDRCLQGPCVTV